MEEVLTAKSVMQQSLFDAEADEDPFGRALQAIETRWRGMAMAALGIAGVALIAALVALGLVIFR